MKLKTRSINSAPAGGGPAKRAFHDVEWDTAQTAVIVCDVWDLHHCLNAVRRLEEFAPRLDEVLKEARKRGAIVIHAPSDCMPAYVDHPARMRAMQAPKAKQLPADVEYWCSQLPQEAGKHYPIDQSDGGEDDDPAEHAEWAAKLKSMGRNPGMPWKSQSSLITIDGDRDYISDRGDEVWNILEQRGIRNVILTGVHCNMCVLGRPFGLRQMARNGKQVVLMRDMTDSMYSPKSWPYVDHFTGHKLVVDYVEAAVCPTITSDQLLGGHAFHWKSDSSERSATDDPKSLRAELNLAKSWAGDITSAAVQAQLQKAKGPVWYRGALRIPEKWLAAEGIRLKLPDQGKFQVWLNGQELQPVPADLNTGGQRQLIVPQDHVATNDYNLLVVKAVDPTADSLKAPPLELIYKSINHPIKDGWQVRLGEDPKYSNIPLPAKFGIGPDAVLRVSIPSGGF